MIEQPNPGPLLAEGKTGLLYADPDDDELAYLVSKDQTTANNELAGRLHWSATTTANIFHLLNDETIATAFVKQINERTLLVRRCKMLPLEFVLHRIATASYVQRHPEVGEGTRFEPAQVEILLKEDATRNTLLSMDEVVKRGLTTAPEIAWMIAQARRVLETLEHDQANVNVPPTNLKIEFGRDMNGDWLVTKVGNSDS